MSNAREARLLLRQHYYGTLSTLSKKFDGHPFGSITPYLTDHDGSLVILISGLAEHTKNILSDPRVSVTSHNQASPQIQTQGRVTLMGNAQLLSDKNSVSARYLRYFPEAESYFSMHDFAFYRINPTAIRYIGGFGRIHWINQSDYQTDSTTLTEQELEIIQHMNQDHADTLIRYCHQLKQQTVEHAEMIGFDSDGFDLRVNQQQLLRFDFDQPVHNALEARQALIALARETTS